MSKAFKKAAVPTNYEDSSKKTKDRYRKEANTTEQYTEHDPISHIYARPDTEIGGVKRYKRKVFVYDGKKYKYVNVDFPDCLERFCLEIISNAGDNADKSRRCGIPAGKLYFTMELDENGKYRTITIKNEGLPIPLDPHAVSDEKDIVYVPERIFNRLKTGSNFDLETENMGIGRNGQGAKLVIIFCGSEG